MSSIIPRMRRKPRLGARLDLQHPLSRGIAGRWLFNEGGGAKLWDISGRNKHGTLTNMDPSSDWIASPKGGALDFDGSNDYVNLGSDPIGTGDVTVSASVCLVSSITSNATFRSIVDNVYFQFTYFRIDPDYWLCCTSDNNNIVAYVFPSSPIGKWFNVAVVRPGAASTNATLYVNGRPVATGNDGNTATAFNVGIGGHATSGLYWPGSIEDVCIYNRLLADAEIQRLHTDPYCNVIVPQYRKYFIASGATFIAQRPCMVRQAVTRAAFY